MADERLQLYIYNGRENGMMIVGTTDSLRALARNLETGYSGQIVEI